MQAETAMMLVMKYLQQFMKTKSFRDSLKKDLWFSLPDILNTTGLVLLTFTDNCKTDDCCHGVNGV